LSPDELAAIHLALVEVDKTSREGDRAAVQAAAEALETATKIFAERRMDRGIRSALAGVSVDRLDQTMAEEP